VKRPVFFGLAEFTKQKRNTMLKRIIAFTAISGLMITGLFSCPRHDKEGAKSAAPHVASVQPAAAAPAGALRF
jgi:hypothetical protein